MINNLLWISILVFSQNLHESKIVFDSVERFIDLSRHKVFKSLDIVVRNLGPDPVDTVRFLIPLNQIGTYYSYKVTENMYTELKMCEKDLKIRQDNAAFDIKLSNSLPNSQTTNLRFEFIQSGVLTPFPEEVAQSERQTLVFNDSCSVLSNYPISSQKTTVSFKYSSVVGFNQCPSSHVLGETIEIGPYNKKMAEEIQTFSLLLQNDTPLPMFTYYNREYYISQWGFISALESVGIENLGAKLKGEYSRYRETNVRHKNGVEFIPMYLPASSLNIQYFDDLGNISTSNILYKRSRIELKLVPRFIIYGGWSTNFYLKYVFSPERFIYIHKQIPHRRLLRIPLMGDLSEEHVINNSTITIYLPEGADNVNISVSHTLCVPEIERKLSIHYLDVVGRPGFMLKLPKACYEVGGVIEVEYDYDDKNMIWKPLRVSIALLLIFTVIHLMTVIKLPILTANKSPLEDKFNRRLQDLNDVVEKLSDNLTQHFSFGMRLNKDVSMEKYKQKYGFVETEIFQGFKDAIDATNELVSILPAFELEAISLKKMIESMENIFTPYLASLKKEISKDGLSDEFVSMAKVAGNSYQEKCSQLRIAINSHFSK